MNDGERRDRVRRVVAAGEQLRAQANDLVPALAASNGLSPESVRLAFDVALERAVTDAELASLLAWAGSEVARVGVVLSAGVFTSALRAVALAWATGARVAVRPSARDPRFATSLVEAIADARVTLTSDLDVARFDGDELHLYGRDATIAAVRARLPEQVRLRAHGHGFGAAYLSAPSREAAAALALDVALFDQRGCLSPRVAFVRADAAADFAADLDGALAGLESRAPRGAVLDDERAEVRRYREAAAFAGDIWTGAAHAVSLAPAIVLPPPGRHLHVVPVASAAEATTLLAPYARFVTAIGTDGASSFASAFPHARTSALGDMQRPPLDGPVDRRPG